MHIITGKVSITLFIKVYVCVCCNEDCVRTQYGSSRVYEGSPCLEQAC